MCLTAVVRWQYQNYTAGNNYSETLRLVYDPSTLSFEKILEAYWSDRLPDAALLLLLLLLLLPFCFCKSGQL